MPRTRLPTTSRGPASEPAPKREVSRTPVRNRVGVLVPNGFPGIPSYLIPEETSVPPVGVRVVVPFGSRLLTGIVVDPSPDPVPEGVEERELLAVVDESPFLPPSLVAVLLRAAEYYFVAPGEMLRAAVPARLLSAGDAIYVPATGSIGAMPEDPRERRVLEAVLLRGRVRLVDLASDVGRQGLGSVVRRLVDSGFLRIPAESLKRDRLAVDRSWIARKRDDSSLSRKPKARAAYQYLLALQRPASLAELRATGISAAILKSLSDSSFVEVVETERRLDYATHVGPAETDRRFDPTPAQADAMNAIGASLSSATEKVFLLDGVTGSGKTEVYLAALEKAKSLGKQGILLVPEIALAPALVRRVLARFGERVSLLHSGLSDGERATEWDRTRRGDVDAVVGPRSAVFAPLPRLGLIVLDEAHESAYKQGDSPRYDARDMARARAKEDGLTLVFGSATPSMEQERSAREGRLPRLLLPSRPGARSRGSVEIVDIRGEAAREGDHGRILFASRTVEILRDAFQRGEQAILLLNRRGFSPSLLCRACGEDFRCSNCAVARTYHLRHERLLCHYCGDAIRRPAACPNCASTVLMPIGFGTERLAERFEEIFSDVPYAVLDRDAAARRGGATRVLADFESGRAQALLGTQMVAKGHDFPNATALAVLDADALLSFPDFRAAERTFQLVTQAAGRVGRRERPGLVAVQTARPEHEAIRAAVRQDHSGFADAELRFRRAFRYPPYTRLLLALFSGPDPAKVADASRLAAAALSNPDLAGIRLFGPAPAPIERLKGLWRHHLLVKTESRSLIARAGSILSQLADPPRIDVDPQNLL